MWNLFGNYRTATEVLGRDTAYGTVVDGLRQRLYLPVVSPTTGWLEEWMSPDNLGETTHRHLSPPLIGLFPPVTGSARTTPRRRTSSPARRPS